jgi:putative ABC transport system ATP-binding protein
MSAPAEPSQLSSPQENQPILSAQAVTKALKNTDNDLELFKSLDLSLAPGERLAIMGTSGVGKSTLLACLAGLDDIDNGEITLLGKPLRQLSLDARAELRRQKVGFIFQNFQLIPHLSALENVALSLEIAGHDRKSAETTAKQALHSVGLAHRENHWPHQLSGGEQQRVAIARASSRVPDLIFADEPTGNLDPKTGAHIMDVLLQLSDTQNTALIVVTHDASIAQRCQRQLQLTEGKLISL